MRSSTARTLTATRTVPALTSTFERSTNAVKLTLAVGTPAGAKYRIVFTFGGEASRNASERVEDPQATRWVVEGLRALGEDEAAIQEGRETGGGELEGPVMDEDPEESTHRGAWTGAGLAGLVSTGDAAADLAADLAACARRGVQGRRSGGTGRHSHPGRSPATQRPPGVPRSGRAAPRWRRPVRRLVEIPHDPAALHEADLAVLLGDHHDERVGLFGDPERRAVARAEPLRVDRGLGQREQRSGGQDGVVTDASPRHRGARHEDGASAEGRPTIAINQRIPVSATSSRPVRAR